MTPPTTLNDEDYRAIARAARRYYSEPAATDAPNWWILDSDGIDREERLIHSREIDDVLDALNGRAAVAEYERRAAMTAAGE